MHNGWFHGVRKRVARREPLNETREVHVGGFNNSCGPSSPEIVQHGNYRTAPFRRWNFLLRCNAAIFTGAPSFVWRPRKVGKQELVATTWFPPRFQFENRGNLSNRLDEITGTKLVSLIALRCFIDYYSWSRGRRGSPRITRWKLNGVLGVV